MLTPEEFLPHHSRPLDPGARWVWVAVPVHLAAVETLSRLAKRQGFSFGALAAQALHHFAVRGPAILREEAAHAETLNRTRSYRTLPP